MTNIPTIAKEYTARIMDRIEFSRGSAILSDDILREVEGAMRAAQAEMSKAPRSFTEQLYADDSDIPVISAEAERFLLIVKKLGGNNPWAFAAATQDHPPLADESATYTRISSDEDLKAGRYTLKRNGI